MHLHAFVYVFKRLIPSIALHFISWDRVSHFADLATLACLLTLGNMSLTLELRLWTVHFCPPSLYVGTEDLNPGPHACMACSLPTNNIIQAPSKASIHLLMIFIINFLRYYDGFILLKEFQCKFDKECEKHFTQRPSLLPAVPLPFKLSWNQVEV